MAAICAATLRAGASFPDVDHVPSPQRWSGACALSPSECVAEFFKLFGGNRIRLRDISPPPEQGQHAPSEKAYKREKQQDWRRFGDDLWSGSMAGSTT